jgi:hypothetical protein
VAKAVFTTGTSLALDDYPDTIPSTTAGQAFTAVAFVKAADPSAVGKPIRVYLREKDAASNVIQDVGSPAVALTNAFQRITVTATTLTSGNRMDVRVGQTSAVAGNAFYADAVSVVPG